MPGGLSRQSLENTWRAYPIRNWGSGRFFLNVPVDKPRAPSSTILSAQLDLEAERHRAAGVAAGGHGPGSGQTRKVGLTIAALMADSGARRLRAYGGGSELDDQRTAVQRPHRSVDNNLSCKFCVASC